LIKFKKESVENCPCCQNSTRSRIIRDWNNLFYYFCSQCGSAFQDPRIIYEYEENYLGDTNDPDGNIRHLSKEQDSKVKNWYGGSIQFVNEAIPGRILDVGAGLGVFLSAIDDAWEKYATEISKYATKYIKERYDNITVFNGNLSKAEFNNEFFDVIMFYHVIEHLENPENELKCLYDLLKKNGVLIIGTPNVSSIAAKIFQGNFRLFGPGHLCLFTPKSLKDILHFNGFEVFKCEYPFWKTEYATPANICRMLMPWKVSPPFYGSIMTFYARKV